MNYYYAFADFRLNPTAKLEKEIRIAAAYLRINEKILNTAIRALLAWKEQTYCFKRSIAAQCNNCGIGEGSFCMLHTYGCNVPTPGDVAAEIWSTNIPDIQSTSSSIAGIGRH